MKETEKKTEGSMTERSEGKCCKKRRLGKTVGREMVASITIRPNKFGKYYGYVYMYVLKKVFTFT